MNESKFSASSQKFIYIKRKASISQSQQDTVITKSIRLRKCPVGICTKQ
jgi:hypothetical protein